MAKVKKVTSKDVTRIAATSKDKKFIIRITKAAKRNQRTISNFKNKNHG